ncbi:MAG: hypothetical protein HKN19_02380 [Halioglobus sp.]|nr:hypothetical protein [Halioglobus sp.]
MNKKIAYVRDRFVNAYWMLREGNFKLIVKSIWIELRDRIEAFHIWRHTRREVPESVMPWSRFVNRRKVVPPSYRPTVSRRMPEEPLKVDRDALVAQLRRSLATIELPGGVDK